MPEEESEPEPEKESDPETESESESEPHFYIFADYFHLWPFIFVLSWPFFSEQVTETESESELEPESEQKPGIAPFDCTVTIQKEPN